MTDNVMFELLAAQHMDEGSGSSEEFVTVNTDSTYLSSSLP